MKNNRTFLEKLLDGAEVEWKTLGEVSELRNTGVDKKINESEKSVRLLNFTDVFNNQYLSNSTPTMIVTASDKKIIDCNILKGDLFITPTSEILDEIGQSAVALENIDNAVYSYHIMRIRIHNTNFLLPEFLNYLFRTSQIKQQIRKNAQGITRFGLTLPRWKSLVIPIPPLSVQTEIVKILDALTALTSELTSELILRQKQYEYYREKLLSEEELEKVGFEWKYLTQVADLTRGRVISKEYLSDNVGDYPVYSSQTVDNGEIGKIDSFDFDGEFVSWTTDGANAGTVFYRSGKFSITNVCGLIKIKNNPELNYKFLFYWLSIEAKKHVYSGMGNPKLMSHQMEKIKIPIPPLSIQTKIVKILDKFESLTNSITEGLPLAIEQSQKRYEYYRELLLNFHNP